MRGPRKTHVLPVCMGELPEEVEQLCLCGDAVILAANDEHGRMYFERIDHWEIRHSLALFRKSGNAALFGQHARCIFVDETPK